MQEFIKNNFVLLSGTGLPILVIIIFICAAKLPIGITDPPKHNFLFYIQEYQHNPATKIRLFIEQGELKAEYSRDKEKRNQNFNNVTRLYLYEAHNGSAREIALAPKISDEYDAWHSFEIPSLGKIKLDSTQLSPDGYRLDTHYRRSGGFLTELLIDNNRKTKIVLTKKNKRVNVFKPNTHEYYYNVKFLGWITKEKRELK